MAVCLRWRRPQDHLPISKARCLPLAMAGAMGAAAKTASTDPSRRHPDYRDRLSPRQRLRGLPGTAAVVDRVGNVLAVFEMNDSAKVVTITSSHDGSSPVMGGLEGVNIIPATLAAIAKAITGLIYPPKAMRSAQEPHLRSCKRTSTQGKPTNPQARSLAFNLVSFPAAIWFRERESDGTNDGPVLIAHPSVYPQTLVVSLLQAGRSSGRRRVYW